MTYIHPTSLIADNVLIGENVYIGPYCVIGFPAEWKGREHESKGIVIGDNVRLTGLITIDSGVERTTEIRAGAYLMKHSHVGHDAVIGENTIISCGAKIGGHTFVGSDCNIGLNAVIHQRQTIANGCMIGMGSVVTKKLLTEPNMKYAGNPAKALGKNSKP